MSGPTPTAGTSSQPRAGATGFAAGVGDVWRAAGFLIGHPKLWIWALIPFVLNVALFVAVAWLGWHLFGGWINDLFFAEDSWWRSLLGWLLRVLFWLLMGLIVLFTFVPLATVVAAPFNDVLSDQVERVYARTGVDEPFSLKLLARGVWVGAVSSVLLAAKTIGLMLLALPLYFVPVAGALLGPAAQAAITIRFIALEHTSYSMDRRYYTFQQKDAFLKRNRARTIGLGAMAFAVMLVPLVNALFIPVSAVAGTMLFCDTERPGDDA